MDHAATGPVYIGAELDADVGSVPQTPLLTRTGSLPTDYVHPLAEEPFQMKEKHAASDHSEGDVVRQLFTRMPADSVPLKKRASILADDSIDLLLKPRLTCATLPTQSSSASVRSLGSRQDSESGLPACGWPESLPRSHTLCSASTSSIHSSDELSAGERGGEKGNATKSSEEITAAGEELVTEDEDGEEPSRVVDRMTPPPPLTPVNSFGIPAGSTPEDFADSEEVDEDEEPMEVAASNSSDEDEAEDMEAVEAADDTASPPAPPAEVTTGADDTTVAPPPPAPFDPSMRPIDIVFSFDTTGSMSSCIEQVQQQLNEIINRLFMDVPNLHIGVIAHGDYCDAEHFYVSELHDLTGDLGSIAGFVGGVTGTGGGDFPECYELVLRRVRTEVKWREWSQRALVMVGDAVPHEADDNPQGINWRDEVRELATSMGVRIYGVQCLASSNKVATPFWKELAETGDGKHLSMDSFATIVDLIMAVVYREFAPDALVAYEREVRAREPITKELGHVFAKLRGADDTEDGDDGSAPGTSDGAPTLPPPAAAIRPAARNGARRATPRKPATPPRKKTATPAKRRGGNPRPKRVTLNQRTKMVLRPKKFTPPPTLRMKLRSSAAGGRTDTTLYYLDSGNKAAAVGNKNAAPLLMADTTSKPKPVRGNRESMLTNQLLGQFAWTPWTLAMKGARDIGTGDAKLAALNTDKHRRAIYELAVQTREEDAARKVTARKYVMCCRITGGVPCGRSWHSFAFAGKALREQLDAVLAQGCTVHVRRAFLPTTLRTLAGRSCRTVEGITREIKSHVSYAWQTNSRRYIRRDGKVISQAHPDK